MVRCGVLSGLDVVELARVSGQAVGRVQVNRMHLRHALLVHGPIHVGKFGLFALDEFVGDPGVQHRLVLLGGFDVLTGVDVLGSFELFGRSRRYLADYGVHLGERRLRIVLHIRKRLVTWGIVVQHRGPDLDRSSRGVVLNRFGSGRWLRSGLRQPGEHPRVQGRVHGRLSGLRRGPEHYDIGGLVEDVRRATGRLGDVEQERGARLLEALRNRIPARVTEDARRIAGGGPGRGEEERGIAHTLGHPLD